MASNCSTNLFAPGNVDLALPPAATVPSTTALLRSLLGRLRNLNTLVIRGYLERAVCGKSGGGDSPPFRYRSHHPRQSASTVHLVAVPDLTHLQNLLRLRIVSTTRTSSRGPATTSCLRRAIAKESVMRSHLEDSGKSSPTHPSWASR